MCFLARCTINERKDIMNNKENPTNFEDEMKRKKDPFTLYVHTHKNRKSEKNKNSS